MAFNPTQQNLKDEKVKTEQSQQTFDDMNSLFNPFGIDNPFSTTNRGGETYEAIFDAAEKMAEAANKNSKAVEYSVIRLLKENYDVHYSAVLLCAKVNDIVKHHILMIESTGRVPHPTQTDHPHQNKSINIPYLPSHILNRDYMSTVTGLISATLKVRLENIYDTDGTLVPNEFVVTNQETLEVFLSEAFVAIMSGIVSATKGFTGFSVKDILSRRKGNFSIDVDFHGADHMWTNSVEMPIRRDVTVDLSYKNANRDPRNRNSGEAITDLVRISGYINPEKLPEPRNRRRDEDYYSFAPNFIITAIQAPGRTAMTEHMAMLGIISLVTLSEDHTWMRAFLNQGVGKNKNIMNNPELLNIEARVGAKEGEFGEPFPLNGSGKQSPEERLDRFFKMIMSPRLAISIDIPEAGPDTWFLSIFRDIHKGTVMDAQKRMNNVLNTLLDGNYRDEGYPMFIGLSNEIHGGYYTEGSRLVDIRKADCYLGVASFAFDRKDPRVLRDYTDSLTYDALDSDIRAYDRMSIIEAVTATKPVVKQYYKRLTFNGRFIDSLARQLREAGFRPTNNSAIADMRSFSNGGYDYAEAGIDSGFRLSEERRSRYSSQYDDYRRRY